MWGAESVSENCASEIGAAAGCLTTKRRSGAGGVGGGRATGSALAGWAGTGRGGGDGAAWASEQVDCVSACGSSSRCAVRGAGPASQSRQGGGRARERGTVVPPGAVEPGTDRAGWARASRLDLKKGRFCGEAGVTATPNSSDRAQDYGEANN